MQLNSRSFCLALAAGVVTACSQGGSVGAKNSDSATKQLSQRVQKMDPAAGVGTVYGTWEIQNEEKAKGFVEGSKAYYVFEKDKISAVRVCDDKKVSVSSAATIGANKITVLN